MVRVANPEEWEYNRVDGVFTAYLRGDRTLAWVEGSLRDADLDTIRRVFKERRASYGQFPDFYDPERLKDLIGLVAAIG